MDEIMKTLVEGLTSYHESRMTARRNLAAILEEALGFEVEESTLDIILDWAEELNS